MILAPAVISVRIPWNFSGSGISMNTDQVCSIVERHTGIRNVQSCASVLRNAVLIEGPADALWERDIARLVMASLAAPDPQDSVDALNKLHSHHVGTRTEEPPSAHDGTVNGHPVLWLMSQISPGADISEFKITAKVAEGGAAAIVETTQPPDLPGVQFRKVTLTWGDAADFSCREITTPMLVDLIAGLREGYE